MPDPVAWWGAATGTAAMAIAANRERVSRRRRLDVAPGAYLNISRRDGSVTHGWASVVAWNIGARPLAIERAGFRWLATEFDSNFDSDSGSVHLWERRASISLSAPLELAVDGPTKKIWTPLGPLLAARLDPGDLVQAYAVTTGGKSWTSPPQPLLARPPMEVSEEALRAGLRALAKSADVPPTIEGAFVLIAEDPYLPE